MLLKRVLLAPSAVPSTLLPTLLSACYAGYFVLRGFRSRSHRPASHEAGREKPVAPRVHLKPASLIGSPLEVRSSRQIKCQFFCLESLFLFPEEKGRGTARIIPFLSYFEKNSSLVGVNFGLCIYVSMYVSFYVLGYVTPIRLRLLYCPGK